MHMLTKTDLSQIQKVVKEVVRTEVETEAKTTRRELQTEMKLSRMKLEERLLGLENRVKDLDIRTESNCKKISHAYDDVHIEAAISAIITSSRLQASPIIRYQTNIGIEESRQKCSCGKKSFSIPIL